MADLQEEPGRSKEERPNGGVFVVKAAEIQALRVLGALEKGRSGEVGQAEIVCGEALRGPFHPDAEVRLMKGVY